MLDHGWGLGRDDHSRRRAASDAGLRQSNAPLAIDRISIELTNACQKACSFCYNASHPAGAISWSVEDVACLVRDCARNGVGAVSFGGGEPLQYPGLWRLLDELRGILFRSLTTNGLLLDDQMLRRVKVAAPDKVHVSLHFPERHKEVSRVIRQVAALAEAGVRSGVNLLVSRSKLDAAKAAAEAIAAADIDPTRVVYLPMRGKGGTDTPTPREMGLVAGGIGFQSVSCLLKCGRSPRFASIDYAGRAAWCSYTSRRVALVEPSYAALGSALNGLEISFCGGSQ